MSQRKDIENIVSNATNGRILWNNALNRHNSTIKNNITTRENILRLAQKEELFIKQLLCSEEDKWITAETHYKKLVKKHRDDRKNTRRMEKNSQYVTDTAWIAYNNTKKRYNDLVKKNKDDRTNILKHTKKEEQLAKDILDSTFIVMNRNELIRDSMVNNIHIPSSKRRRSSE
jgi:hypothetical protein